MTLGNCAALAPVLGATTGVSGVGGEVLLSGNQLGCNSIDEILASFVPEGPSETAFCKGGGSITLTSQAEVDTFQAGENCNTVSGSLTVSGPDITNLDGLAGVTRIEGRLELVSPALSDIRGLSSLKQITGRLNVGYGSEGTQLLTLEGLDNLVELGGGLTLYENSQIQHIDALSNIVETVNDIWIQGNDALENIDGLAQLETLEGGLVIRGNSSLRTIDLPMQLRRIEGTLEFVSNESLTSISGFSKLDYLGGALFFKYNKALESLVEGLRGSKPSAVTSRYSTDNLADLDPLSKVANIGELFANRME